MPRGDDNEADIIDSEYQLPASPIQVNSIPISHSGFLILVDTGTARSAVVFGDTLDKEVFRAYFCRVCPTPMEMLPKSAAIMPANM